MTKREEFDNLYMLYTTISDIDNIINSDDVESPDKETKLDRVLFAIKSIDKHVFSDNFTEDIITSIRKAVVELYDKELVKVNASIGIETKNKIDSDTVYRDDNKKGGVFSVAKASEALRSNKTFRSIDTSSDNVLKKAD